MVKERGGYPSKGMRVKRRIIAKERGSRQQNDESMVKERGVYASRGIRVKRRTIAKERGLPAAKRRVKGQGAWRIRLKRYTCQTTDHWLRSGGGRGKHRGQSTSKWLRSVANILQGLSVSNDESWLRSVANIRLRRYLVCGASKWR